jgi:hypothetical protein
MKVRPATPDDGWPKSGLLEEVRLLFSGYNENVDNWELQYEY